MATHRKTAMLITKRGQELLQYAEERFSRLAIDPPNTITWALAIVDGKQVCFGRVMSNYPQPCSNRLITTIWGESYKDLAQSIEAFTDGWKEASVKYTADITTYDSACADNDGDLNE